MFPVGPSADTITVGGMTWHKGRGVLDGVMGRTGRLRRYGTEDGTEVIALIESESHDSGDKGQLTDAVGELRL